MGNEYARFKKQFMIDAVVKALLVFLSTSLLVIAAFLIAIEKAGLDFEIAYAILIGIVSGLLLGFGSFFVFHLSEKRLAERLDKMFNLNEKVQTMYAFRNDNGSVTSLQRADTQAILSECTLKTSRLVRGWIAFIAVAVLALAFFITSIVITLSKPDDVDTDKGDGQGGQTEPLPDEGEGFEPTEHHLIALLELIEYVKASHLQEDAKAEVVSELELLVSKLDTFGTEVAMKSYVIGVITRVRATVNAVNTTYAMNQAVADDSNEYLLDLNKAVFSLVFDNVKISLRGLYDSFSLDYAAYYDCKNKQIEKDIDSLVKDLTSLLNSTPINSDLRSAVLELCNKISAVQEHVTTDEEIDVLNASLLAVLENPTFKEGSDFYDLLIGLGEKLKAMKEHEAAENKIAPFIDGLASVLDSSKLTDKDDLYVVLKDLCERLDEVREHKMATKRAVQKIESALLTYTMDGLRIIVISEKNNEDVKVEVVKRLENIFGIDVGDEESRDYSDGTETVDPEDRPEIGDDGGFGTGDMLFGSNDLVIDIEKEPGNDIDSIKVEYGKIIARYDAEITRMIESGEISEETGKMLREYFEVLLTPKESK